MKEIEPEIPLTPFQKRLHAWWDRHWDTVYILGLLVIFLMFYFFPSVVHFVHSGHAGVVWKRFNTTDISGTQTDRVYMEGTHLTWPWDVFTDYDVRVQQARQEFSVISSNGLTLEVTLTIRYRPNVELLPILHKNVGETYYQKIVLPEVQSLVRLVFGQYSPEEIYTSKRNVIQKSLAGAMGEIGERYVILDDLLIERILLPPTISNAIEAKLTEEQRYLEMQYRLKREEEEANRRIIEAKGINESQLIISQSLTPLLLQYKGIEATLDLAMSDNAKVVIFGNSNGGLPFILNAESAPLSQSGLASLSLTNVPPVLDTNGLPRASSLTNLFRGTKP